MEEIHNRFVNKAFIVFENLSFISVRDEVKVYSKRKRILNKKLCSIKTKNN
jgi:hypothetical protein